MIVHHEQQQEEEETRQHTRQDDGEDLFQDKKILFLKIEQRNIKRSSARPTFAFR